MTTNDNNSDIEVTAAEYPNNEEQEQVLCACGCGTVIESIDSKGRKRRFISGHNTAKREKSPFWKGGKTLFSGYVLISKPDHPYASKQGRIFEHRLVMEECLGRYLTKNEVVHHINGNRSDNRIGNLELITRDEHARLHHIGKSLSDEHRRRLSIVNSHPRPERQGVPSGRKGIFKQSEKWRITMKRVNTLDMSGRQCVRCRSSKTRIRKNNPRQDWYTLGGKIRNNLANVKWLCHKCYMKMWHQKKAKAARIER